MTKEELTFMGATPVNQYQSKQTGEWKQRGGFVAKRIGQNYTDDVMLEVWGEQNIQRLMTLKQGDKLNVSYSVSSRSYEKEGKTNWITSARCISVDIMQNGQWVRVFPIQQSYQPQPMAQPQQGYVQPPQQMPQAYAQPQQMNPQMQQTLQMMQNNGFTPVQ